MNSLKDRVAAFRSSLMRRVAVFWEFASRSNRGLSGIRIRFCVDSSFVGSWCFSRISACDASCSFGNSLMRRFVCDCSDLSALGNYVM